MAKYTTYETDEIYEVWDGEKIMMSPSSPRHESIVGKLYFFIITYVSEHSLGAVYLSNTAIHLKNEDRDFLMPDITFVSQKNKHLVKENGIYGAPDLVVEVISAGLKNARRDLIDKFQKYEKYGVSEYWLVDPFAAEIEIYALQDNKYVEVEQSIVLDGIRLLVDKIFAEDFSENDSIQG
ncbi:MAG TPA: Uma2 family endonuclease [Bacilli bacterium]